ncbi:multidrug transporter MatE [Burkholderia paludis]|uniref:MATE family efflux transporter n=1 Tax=Burkholderia paludis TaxID=1506587 RepID=UPI0004DB6FEA|nr:MATE family efflux transporter [Burkholderia paludis]KFG97886.1 multidrug transporter MatE [Burkholderia paludis]
MSDDRATVLPAATAATAATAASTAPASRAERMRLFAAEVRATWLMLYPMVLSSIFGYCMTLFDYRWIRDLPAEDMALLALVNGSVATFLFLLAKSFEESFVAVFAKAPREEQGRLFVQSLVFAAGVGVLVVLVLIGTRAPLMTFISGGHFRDARMFGYYALVVGSFPLTLLSTALSAAMRTYGDTKSPARISIACGVVNNLLDPLLVFGLFGQHPSLQLFGLALTSWITKSLYLGWSIRCIRPRLRREQVALPRPGLEWPTQRRLLNIFLPSAALESLTFLANTAVYSMIARYGVRAIGGYGIGFELMTIGFILIKGLSMVFMIRIGHLVRSRAPSRAALQSVMLLGVLFTAAISVAFFLLRPLALRFLASDAGVIEVATALLDYVPLFVFSYLLTNLVTGCFQILERPARAMALGLFFSWAVTPGAIYLGVTHHLALAQLFALLAGVSVVRQAVYLTIFLRLMRRLGAAPGAAPAGARPAAG